MVILYFIHNSP